MPNDHSPIAPGADDCAPCGLHQPVRNAYFDGKMLTARDLSAEQTYLNGLRHLGHSLLDGTGTVCGLKVQSHPQDGCKTTHVVLTRGMALSCCGQEIIVPQDVTIPVLKMLQADTELQSRLTGTNDLVISICRQDNPAEMAPVLISDCCSGLDGRLPSRVAEGYGFKLSAQAPGTQAKERTVLQPDLDWVHSINTEDETPTAVEVDDEDGLVYIASQLDDKATIRAYDALTNALVLSLTGWARVDDIVAQGAGKRLIVGGVRGGKTVVATYSRRPDHLAEPEAEVSVMGAAQLALSPATNALFALCLDDAGLPTLLGWTEDQLATDLINPTLTLTGTENVDAGPQQSGARLIEVSPDGRQLALLLPGLEQALHLGSVSDLLSGGVAKLDMMAQVIMTEQGVNVSKGYAGASSLKYSYDNKLLHVVGRLGEAPEEGFYARIFLNDVGPTQTGRGLNLALSEDKESYAALYVAPDERWIYVSTASRRGEAGEVNGMLAVYATDPAKQPGAADSVTDPIQIIPLNAQLSGGALRIRGQRAYLPGFQNMATQTPEPVRGRVMVVDIAETNIAAIFEAAVEGCTTCADNCSCVDLAHLPGYTFPSGPNQRFPQMLDPGLAGVGDVAIDNLTYRPIVPSNVTLMEAILEIAARGVESGPPGPRGEDGLTGAAGSTGTDGRDGTNGTDGDDGLDGARGRSIAEVAFDSANTPRLEPVAGADSDFRLYLPKPAEARDPRDYQFVTGTNWDNGKVFDLQDLLSGSLADMKIHLYRVVDNADILFTPGDEPDLPHFYLSGVLEIRVHTHRDLVFKESELHWSPDLGSSRTFQYSPRFEKPEAVFAERTFILPVQQLWEGLQQLEIRRARVEVVLHGSFLTNAEGVPFDGRSPPQATADLAGQTGGTWRSWIEVQTIKGRG